MALDPAALPEEVLGFLAERHLASLTTLRADGTPHVVPVGFAFDPKSGLVRVITGAGSQKATNAARGGRAVVCQVDGRRWLSLEGRVTLTEEPQRVATAVAAYTGRYRQPGDNPSRVAIEILVDRVLGRA
ncbi:MAG: PPOX class F420-dependent oxidoreductase [Actinomycetota bacterium]|nr:PPOX class F420-dependent oxidoreductase [Actinomycetota bacterium]